MIALLGGRRCGEVDYLLLLSLLLQETFGHIHARIMYDMTANKMGAAGCSSAETTLTSTHIPEVPVTSYKLRYVDNTTPSFTARRTHSLRHGMLHIIIIWC